MTRAGSSDKVNAYFETLAEALDGDEPYWLGVDSGKAGGIGLLDKYGSYLNTCAWKCKPAWDNGAAMELLGYMGEIAADIYIMLGRDRQVVIVHELPAGVGRSNSWQTFAPAMMLLGALKALGVDVVGHIAVHNTWWKSRAGIKGTTKQAKAQSVKLAHMLTGLDMTHDEADAHHIARITRTEYEMFLQRRLTK